MLQGFMQACMLAESVSLGTALRTVLDGFHSQKSQAKVDALLLRLYEPLIFRGMAAANNTVRQNAFLLLFDAFPLQVDLHDVLECSMRAREAAIWRRFPVLRVDRQYCQIMLHCSLKLVTKTYCSLQ